MDNFGKYNIERKIGEGGTATVYLAKETVLNRDVVLKIMSNQQFSGVIDFKKLFIEEAQRIAKLNHPNIIQVYEAGIEDNRIYIAMEYLSGGTLKDRIIQKQPFDPIQVLKDIASALHYAYLESGTIHRDIKPANIIFRKRSEGKLDAVLTDFGISKTEGIESDFTNFDMKVGTPRYMSPEQLLGGNIDQRSDLYSLGIVFYEMLTGEKPYNADNTVAVIQSRTRSSTPKLPNEYQKYQGLIDKLITPHPDDRFRTTKDLLKAIDELDSKRKKDIKPAKNIKLILSIFLATTLVTASLYFGFNKYKEYSENKIIMDDIKMLEKAKDEAELNPDRIQQAITLAEKMNDKHPANDKIKEILTSLRTEGNALKLDQSIKKFNDFIAQSNYNSAKESLTIIEGSFDIPETKLSELKDKLAELETQIEIKSIKEKMGNIDIISSKEAPKAQKEFKITAKTTKQPLYLSCLYQSPAPDDDKIMRLYPIPKPLFNYFSELKKYKTYKKLSTITIPVLEELSGIANVYCFATNEGIKNEFNSLFKNDSNGLPYLKKGKSIDDVKELISDSSNNIYIYKNLKINITK